MLIKVTDKNDKVLSIIGHMGIIPEGLNFVNSPEDFIQCATFNYEKNHLMRDHRHIEHDVELTKWKMQELLLIWQGSVECRIFDESDELVKVYNLTPGHFVLVLNGGIGYTTLENDTRLLEVKGGIFPGSEKDRVLIGK